MLRGRSSHELFTRASQEAYAWSERASLRLGNPVGGPAPALTNADLAFSQPFFEGISNANETVAALRVIAPADIEQVLQRASAIERGEIPLLGYGNVNIGQSPDWQRDPFAGLTAPMRHWKTIPYLDPAIVGDHKVVWEISRHQYFVTLGQAWQISRDERWPRVFVRLIQSWLDTNPPSIGMNWASSLEVSYRAISWIWALQLMRDSSVVDGKLKQRVMESLRAHGRHLERYLSTYFSPNTHLTGEALGLFYIGTQCPELPRAKQWTQIGADALEKSLAFQVLPDGVYFEQATQYHRYTIDIYLHYLLLARLAGRAPAPVVERALNRLFDVLLHLTRGDGTIPLMGDDDGGRLVQLDDRLPHEVRALLATGAVVLQRGDLAWAGRGDDASMCWMLGAGATRSRDALVTQSPAQNAHAFTSGGLFTMRDGWGHNDAHIAIDAGPHGALSFGHSHADALSVELSIGGRPLFVDPGTFTYVGADRNAFRTTAAHNTIEIDATSTSRPDTAFRWATVAHATGTDWVSDDAFAYFAGSHDGYSALSSPLQHERSVLRAGAGLFVVLDSLSSAGAHDAVLRWQCASGVSITSEESGQGFSVVGLSQAGSERAILVTFGGTGGAMHIERGWVSPQFARKVEANVLAWKERLTGNSRLASIVMDTARWEIAQEATLQHRQQVQGAKELLVLRSEDALVPEHRVVMIGGASPMHFRDLTITADIACLQLDAVTGTLVGITAVGVTHAVNSGVALVPVTTEKRWIHVSDSDGGAAGSWQVRSGKTALIKASAVAAPEVDASATLAQSRKSPVSSHA